MTAGFRARVASAGRVDCGIANIGAGFSGDGYAVAAFASFTGTASAQF